MLHDRVVYGLWFGVHGLCFTVCGEQGLAEASSMGMTTQGLGRTQTQCVKQTNLEN